MKLKKLFKKIFKNDEIENLDYHIYALETSIDANGVKYEVPKSIDRFVVDNTHKRIILISHIDDNMRPGWCGQAPGYNFNFQQYLREESVRLVYNRLLSTNPINNIDDRDQLLKSLSLFINTGLDVDTPNEITDIVTDTIWDIYNKIKIEYPTSKFNKCELDDTEMKEKTQELIQQEEK